MSEDEHKIKCDIGGEEIRHLGTIRQLERYDFVPDSFAIYDGADTDAGAICEVCLPVYQKARAEVYLFDEVAVREQVRLRIARADFVTTSRREHAEETLIPFLLEALRKKGYFDEYDVRMIQSFFERGINIGEFKNSGKLVGGIDLAGAAKCLREEERTFKFVKALFGRIDELDGKRDSVIEVVDAGCGPYPLWGVFAALKSEKVRSTCLELNPASADMARKIIANLGLEDRVEIVEADATEYKHGREIDLLVSETMYSGFLQEPLPYILINLTPQVAQDGYVIPQWAAVEAGLVRSERARKPRWFLPENFDLGPMEVVRFVRGKFDEVVRFEITLTGIEPGNYNLALGLRAGLSEDVVLEGLDSAITIPHLIPTQIDVQRGDTLLKVSYAVGVEDTDLNIEKV
ncbi:MAG: hypothetical protein O3B47_04330 [bacterium]|nr:hypothetical protein [bacterium]